MPLTTNYKYFLCLLQMMSRQYSLGFCKHFNYFGATLSKAVPTNANSGIMGVKISVRNISLCITQTCRTELVAFMGCHNRAWPMRIIFWAKPNPKPCWQNEEVKVCCINNGTVIKYSEATGMHTILKNVVQWST